MMTGELTRPAYLEFVMKDSGFAFHWDNLHIGYELFQTQFLPELKTAIGLPAGKWFERQGGGWWHIPLADMVMYEIAPDAAERAIVRTIQRYVGDRGVHIISSMDLRDGGRKSA